MSSITQIIIKDVLKPYYHKFQRICKSYRRIGLHSKDFSIISNNCAGGYVYQFYGIAYNTPTEGIGFSVDDYLKIVDNPEHYFKHSLEFVDPPTTPRYKNGEHFRYPAAKIDDIFVYFRHYPTMEEAEKKWIRRSRRINYNKIFFLLTESETMREEHILLFNMLISKGNRHGVMLTSRICQLPHIKTVLNVPVEKGILQWTPEIIISSLDWKTILNNL